MLSLFVAINIFGGLCGLAVFAVGFVIWLIFKIIDNILFNIWWHR